MALAGCQSTARFSEAQIAAMKSAGFTQNMEGWGLGLSDKILFGINESELTPASKTTIQTMARNLCALTGTPTTMANRITTSSCH